MRKILIIIVALMVASTAFAQTMVVPKRLKYTDADLHSCEALYTDASGYTLCGDLSGTYVPYTGASSDVDLDEYNLTTTGLGTFDKLTLTAPTQDYLFTSRAHTLALQSQTSGGDVVLGLYTKDADGTDQVNFQMFGKGTPSDISNFELFQIQYNPGGYIFLTSVATGAGTIRPIIIQATDTDQLVVGSNGGVGVGKIPSANRFEVSKSAIFESSITVSSGADFYSGIEVSLDAYFNSDIFLPLDSHKIWFGAGQDASICYDGTNLHIDAQEVGSGHIILNSPKTTTGDPTGVEGKIYWNTVDNVIKMYADGGWRTLASW